MQVGRASSAISSTISGGVDVGGQSRTGSPRDLSLQGRGDGAVRHGADSPLEQSRTDRLTQQTHLLSYQ